MTRKKPRIGFDFDGVIAYSPTRLIRSPISFIKKRILKKKKVSFFVPHKKWQMWIWAVIFGPSVFPERGAKLIPEFEKHNDLFIITGRFDFLETSMKLWLNKHKLTECFKEIIVNRDRQQPHEFKKYFINKLNLNYFIEDNWDAVQFLTKNCPKTKILWIYNIVDKNIEYDFKYPYLEKALEYVRKERTI